MDKISGECIFSNLSRVVFGPGKVAEVAAELKRVDARRTIIVTGRTLAASPLIDHVKAAVGDRCVGVFQDIVAHGAKNSGEALAIEMRKLDADSLVSFGGSSVSDSGKVAIAAVLSGRKVEDMATMNLFDVADLGVVTRKIHHICLPTTLSAGGVYPGRRRDGCAGAEGRCAEPRHSDRRHHQRPRTHLGNR